MSLREIMNQTVENYDPKDNPNLGQSGLPAGEYDVVVEKVGFTIYDSGYDCIAFDLKVVIGDYSEQHEFININIDPEYKWNKEFGGSLLKRNIKSIVQFAYATDVTLTDDDWEDQQAVGDALTAGAIGQQCLLRITESTNKKGKVNKNYEFIKYDDVDPF